MEGIQKMSKEKKIGAIKYHLVEGKFLTTYFNSLEEFSELNKILGKEAPDFITLCSQGKPIVNLNTNKIIYVEFIEGEQE